MLDQVIVAFESEKTCRRVADILESAGTAACLICRTGDQVRRYANKQHITVVVCGYKLGEETAEDVLGDLPAECAMLLLAPQSRLDMVRGDRMFRLSAPAARSELIASVRMLLQLGEQQNLFRPRRNQEEQEQVKAAKLLLMERYGLNEGQAHRFLQKKSMDPGMTLAQPARLVLGED